MTLAKPAKLRRPGASSKQEERGGGSGGCYTIEKAGVRKLIYQAPWYRDRQYAGFVEIAIELPAEVQNHCRQ